MLDEEKQGEVEGIIKLTHGQFFGIVFKKRTNGERRVMNARVGVRKFVKGDGMKYNPEEKNLIPVWDRNAFNSETGDLGYRMIPIEAVEQINFAGIKFTIQEVKENDTMSQLQEGHDVSCVPRRREEVQHDRPR
jgi:hypothetical protein